jgi:hypothetical protein
MHRFIYASAKTTSYVYCGTHKVTSHFYYGYRCANIKLNRTSSADFGLFYKTSAASIKSRFDEFDWTILAEFMDDSTGDYAYDHEQLCIYENWNDPLILNDYYDHLNTNKFRNTPESRNKIIRTRSAIHPETGTSIDQDVGKKIIITMNAINPETGTSKNQDKGKKISATMRLKHAAKLASILSHYQLAYMGKV